MTFFTCRGRMTLHRENVASLSRDRPSAALPRQTAVRDEYGEEARKGAHEGQNDQHEGDDERDHDTQQRAGDRAGTPTRQSRLVGDQPDRRAQADGDRCGDERAEEAERIGRSQRMRAVAELATQIDELTLPAARKAELRAELGGLAEAIKRAEKAAAADRAKDAARQASVLADSAESAQEPYCITTIDLGSDRGALQAAMKTITDRVPRKAVMLLSPDEGSGKVAVVATVPKDLQGRLKAGDWVRHTVGVMGGKGGGKPDSAQGAGSDLGKVREAVREAQSFAGQKLL